MHAVITMHGKNIEKTSLKSTRYFPLSGHRLAFVSIPNNIHIASEAISVYHRLSDNSLADREKNA